MTRTFDEMTWLNGGLAAGGLVHHLNSPLKIVLWRTHMAAGKMAPDASIKPVVQHASSCDRDGSVMASFYSVCVIVSMWVFSATLFCFSLSLSLSLHLASLIVFSYLVIGAPPPRTMGIGTSTVGGTPPRSEPDAADLNTRRHKTTEPVEAPEFQVPVAGAAVSVSGLVHNQG